MYAKCSFIEGIVQGKLGLRIILNLIGCLGDCKAANSYLIDDGESIDGQKFGYALDEFQLRAACCTMYGESVVVAAPTSSGKTSVAECAIHQALAQHRSCIFCSPTKALSNQKFLDFQAKFGRSEVGLLTGDVSISRNSRILVATTEVL